MYDAEAVIESILGTESSVTNRIYIEAFLAGFVAAHPAIESVTQHDIETAFYKWWFSWV